MSHWPSLLESRPMFMHDNGLTFITNFMINCYRCVADAMAEQARLTQPSPIQIWLDFCQTEPEFGLIFLLLNMIIKGSLPVWHVFCRPWSADRYAISRWLIPRDWSLFLENIKSFYFISFINPLYSYFVLNWFKKPEICFYDSEMVNFSLLVFLLVIS